MNIEQRVTTLECQLKEAIEVNSEQQEEINLLKKWKQHCSIAAAGWGGMCMAAVTMGGLIHSYWDSIKAYVAGSK